MKFNYSLQRLCGGSYGSADLASGDITQGANIIFTSSGDTLLSPVGNRIQIVDLKTHSVRTLSCQTRSNIRTIAISPKEDNKLLLAIDVDGYCMLVNFHLSVVLYRYRFKKSNIHTCVFSPCGTYIAFNCGCNIQVWYAPSTARREFAPFTIHSILTGLTDNVVDIDWSPDSSVIMASCRNGTVRIWSIDKLQYGKLPVTLNGHSTSVVGVYFEKPSLNNTFPGQSKKDLPIQRMYTIDAEGAIATWELEYEDKKDEMQLGRKSIENLNNAVDFFSGQSNVSLEESTKGINTKNQAEHLANVKRWKIASRHYFDEKSNVTTTSFSGDHNLLVVGFASGIFGLYELPSMSNIHTLSLSNQFIRTVAINCSAEWLAFGCPSTQQLLVWEWRSETYVIKQRGHAYGMRCMAYSEDGVIIVTGGEDGSLKLWNTTSGLCYCTLKSHTAAITGCTFANNSVVMSSCLDGTVRAWDLHRYRNFRTYTSPTPNQFSCVGVDPAGEILVAGTQDDYHIYVWNVQTGKLLDILTGHLGPISEIDFHPNNGTLASSSWDGNVKVWDLYKRENSPESLKHARDVICCAFRPDGVQCVTGTIGGLLSVWNIEDSRLICEIDGKRDISTRSTGGSRYFTSVCYSADGNCVIAGGNCPYVCIYEVSQQLLIKKFIVSSNRSLGRHLDGHKDTGKEFDRIKYLPGAKRTDDGSRQGATDILTMQVSFSSTGREWAAVSNEGLLIYSLDDDIIFDPISMTEDITPARVYTSLKAGNYVDSLLMSLHLNEFSLVRQVIEDTPYKAIVHVVKCVNPDHLENLIQYLSKCMEDSPHIEFYVQWCCEILTNHGSHMEKHRSTFMKSFRSLHKIVSHQHDEMKRICDENSYTLDFVHDQSMLVNNKEIEKL